MHRIKGLGQYGREFFCNAGDSCLIPGVGGGRSPGEGNGNTLEFSCLENPVDRGAWPVTVHGISESDTTKQLNSTTVEFSIIRQDFPVDPVAKSPHSQCRGPRFNSCSGN